MGRGYGCRSRRVGSVPGRAGTGSLERRAGDCPAGADRPRRGPRRLNPAGGGKCRARTRGNTHRRAPGSARRRGTGAGRDCRHFLEHTVGGCTRSFVRLRAAPACPRTRRRFAEELRSTPRARRPQRRPGGPLGDTDDLGRRSFWKRLRRQPTNRAVPMTGPLQRCSGADRAALQSPLPYHRLPRSGTAGIRDRYADVSGSNQPWCRVRPR
jgi:hypothetical protein